MLHSRALAFAVLAGLLCSVPAWTEPVCQVCRQVVLTGFRVNDATYCSEHWQEALPNCANCDTPITEAYRIIGIEKTPFCDPCMNRFPSCYFCYAPVDPQSGGKTLRDGRKLCGKDVKEAVFSAQRARELYALSVQEVIAALGSRLKLKTPVKEIHLVDVAGLVKASGGSYHTAAVADGRLLGLTRLVFKARGQERWSEPAAIYLLDGVPSQRFVTVCAHEYAHAWHAESHPNYLRLSREMREGFAEWVAYRSAQHAGRNSQVATLLLPSSNIYYSGLQKFLALEAKSGVEGVLKHAVTASSI